MKKIILLLICVIAIKDLKAQAPTFDWAKGIGGTSNDFAYSVSVDLLGNVYTTGYFSGIIDSDPSASINNLTSNGNEDVFISKLDASGNFIWGKNIGGASNDEAFSVVTDISGNIFTTGSFQGTVDFDPGIGVFNLTASGFSDLFILKLDPLGNFVWAKSISGDMINVGLTIKTDASGNVFTSGYFSGTVDFDPGSSIVNMTSLGNENMFILKLNNSGNFLWVKTMVGNASGQARSIALDPVGNIYYTGYFNGTIDFDPGPGIFTLASTLSNTSIFISKLDPAGNFLWASSPTGNYFGFGYAIEVDPAGNIYFTGSFAGTADFDPGLGTYNLTSVNGTDIFISKLNSSGNFIWTKQIGGISLDESYALDLDVSGNVYVSGFFQDTLDFDPGPLSMKLVTNGGADAYIVKLDASGNFKWVKQLGGPLNDFSYSIFLDQSGSIYTTGYFEGTVDFDPNAAVVNLNSAGLTDIYVHKMNPSNVGIMESQILADVKLYPNPCQDKLCIRGQDLANVEFSKMEVVNNIGQVVKEADLNYNNETINVADLPNGVYLLNVKSDDSHSISKRFVIAH